MNIPKGLLTKAMIATSIAGIVGFGTLTFNDGGIDTIKEKFDYLKQNYENALVTINNYKDVLAQKVKDIRGYEAIQDDLLAQIDDLKAQIAELEKFNLDKLPICMAKTQYSLSDNPALLGRPEGFEITVKEVRVSNGAGFIVALTGDIMTMPGLPKVPAANRIDILPNGEIVGLF